MANRIQIPFSFNYPSGGNLVPAASVSVAVYTRNNDGSQGSPSVVFQAQSGTSQYGSLQTDAGGNVPGWVAEGTYKIVAAASGGFGGGTINFDALYGGGTAQIATNAVGPTQLVANAVDIPQLSVAVANALIPSGVILDYAGNTPPTGFLACNGSIVAQTSYPALYSAIGSTWNTGGEGTGNFRLPAHMGRISVGSGTGAGLSARTLAALGGEENHQLALSEIAQHNHGVGSLYTGSSGTGISIAGAGTGISIANSYADGLGRHVPATYGGNWGQYGCASGPYAFPTPPSGVGDSALYHTHGVSDPGHGHGVYDGGHAHGIGGAVDYQGSNAVHNNMQPYLVVTKIIKT